MSYFSKGRHESDVAAPYEAVLWHAGALLDVLCNAFHSDSACVAIMEPTMKVRSLVTCLCLYMQLPVPAY